MTFKQMVANGMFSGRKMTRWMTLGVLAAIGLALSIAFIRWAFGAPFPEIPGQGIIIAALPYAQQMWDNFVRQQGKTALAAANHPAVNPHRGPDAP